MHGAFNTYPFLYLNAMKGSGKTRVLNIIASLSREGNGQVQAGITEAVLFRTPKGHTIILDECESIGGREKAVLREYVNACYKKGGVGKRTKKVKTKEGEDYKIDVFEPYKPISMANIWGMDDVLGDRCLTVILEKSNKKGITKKIEDFDTRPEVLEIKRTLEGFYVVLCSVVMQKEYTSLWNDYIDKKYNYTTTSYTYKDYNYIDIHEDEEIFKKIDEADIDGRNLELLFPLLITTRLLNEDLFFEILRIGKDIIHSKKGEEFVENKDVSLIDFVSTRHEDYGKEFNQVKSITGKFKEFLGEEEDTDRWLNSKWVGRALKRLGLVKVKKRVIKGIEVVLDVQKAREKIKIFKSEEER